MQKACYQSGQNNAEKSLFVLRFRYKVLYGMEQVCYSTSSALPQGLHSAYVLQYALLLLLYVALKARTLGLYLLQGTQTAEINHGLPPFSLRGCLPKNRWNRC